jgi:nicotinamidase/pyrazinamidase
MRTHPKKFVVFVDTQGDFVFRNGKLPVADAESILADLLRYASELSPDEVDGVLFTFDTHERETYMGSPENLGNPDAGEPGFDIHCERGTPGWENVVNPRLIDSRIPVYTLEKGVFDMWAEDNIEVHGEQMYAPKNRDAFIARFLTEGQTVEVVGVAADFCVKWAVDGFVKRGFHVVVPSELTRGIIRQIDQVVEEDYAEGSVTVI